MITFDLTAYTAAAASALMETGPKPFHVMRENQSEYKQLGLYIQDSTVKSDNFIGWNFSGFNEHDE